RPARHQTLRDAIQWSYALLTPEEQALFRKVAVFVGGFTAEAAAALDLNDVAVEPLLSHLTAVVWPDPQLVDPTVVPPVRPRPTDTPNTLATIIALVNQSLVYQETYIATDEPRFRLLETIREFGLTLLEQHGELAAVRHRHALYYLALAADAETQLNGPHYQQWLTWLEQEYNNLRAAWDWAVANRAYEVAMRLGCGLYHFWVRKGYEGEGQERMTALLPIVRNLPPSPALARYLFAVALLIDFHTGDRNRSKAIYEQSVQVCRAIGDDLKLAHPLNRLGGFAYTRGDYGMWATNLAEAQACRSKHHDWWGYALVHGHTGRELAGLGRIDEGRAACEEALALERQIGDSWGTVVTLQNFGEVTLLAGDLAGAEGFLLESLALSRDLDDNYLMAIARYLLGAVALERGDLDQAERRLHGALEIMVALTNRQYTIEILAALAALALRQAQAIRALLLATVVTQQQRVDGIVLPPVKQARFDQLVARACAQLPAAVAAHTQPQGEALSPADAVALVLLADDGNRLDTGVFPS
ncbi:MAG: hypothetical protein KDE58_33335, partial [Caldilineaceae bacterium]|nr:hypothetical protein [Caldilineaceae bacterium]